MERNSSFEILRLVLMLLILMHHVIINALGLSGITDADPGRCIIRQEDMPWAFVINSLCIVSVNAFVLISGYFGISLRWKKILLLVLTVYFYTIALTTIPCLISHDWGNAASSLMVFGKPRYWFIREYIFLMLASMLVNPLFEKNGLKVQAVFTMVMVFICCYIGWLRQHSVDTNGYNFFNFILLYSVGRMINIHRIKVPGFLGAVCYVIPALATGLLSYYLLSKGQAYTAWKMTYYNNPLVIISSIGLFFMFTQFEFRSKTVNTVAQSALAIYLFSESKLVSDWYKEATSCCYDTRKFLYIILIVLMISTIALAIDRIRLLVLHRL